MSKKAAISLLFVVIVGVVALVIFSGENADALEEKRSESRMETALGETEHLTIQPAEASLKKISEQDAKRKEELIEEYKERMARKEESAIRRINSLANENPEMAREYYGRRLEAEISMVEEKNNLIREALENGGNKAEIDYLLETLELDKQRIARIEAKIGTPI